MTEVKDRVLPPPPVRPAAIKKATRGGPVPRLDTYWRVEHIIRQAHERDEDPITFEEIKRRLGVKSVRHSTVRACVAEIERQGNAAVTPSGVLWCPMSKDAIAYEAGRDWILLP